MKRAKFFSMSVKGMRVAAILIAFVCVGIFSPLLGAVGVATAVLVGTHTGATQYSGSIESPIARLYINADGAAMADINGAKLTVTQATKKRTGTMIPELTLSQLGDIAGFIDGIIDEDTTLFTKTFSIPISLGGAYDMEGGALTYSLTNCIATTTFLIYAIDDAKRENDYIDIVPIGCAAGGVKTLDAMYGTYLFVDPTNLTRLKLIYASGLAIEYLGAEIMEIAKVVNPVHSLSGATAAKVLKPGYGTLSGVNIMDAVQMEVTLTAAGVVYMVKHLLAN